MNRDYPAKLLYPHLFPVSSVVSRKQIPRQSWKRPTRSSSDNALYLRDENANTQDGKMQDGKTQDGKTHDVTSEDVKPPNLKDTGSKDRKTHVQEKKGLSSSKSMSHLPISSPATSPMTSRAKVVRSKVKSRPVSLRSSAKSGSSSGSPCKSGKKQDAVSLALRGPHKDLYS